MNKPKFCVGEEVKTKGIVSGKWDSDRDEITESSYSEFVGCWIYKSVKLPESRWWLEGSLHKLHPRPENSFDSIMKQYNAEVYGV